jgi:hypothetical protein
MQRIAFLNHSTDPKVTTVLLQEIAAACERQLHEHYAPFWQSAGIPVTALLFAQEAKSTDALVVVFDHADQAGVLGYHDVTPAGLPYGRVFLSPILESGGTCLTGGNSLSCTLSHEVLEAVGDPYCNWWAEMGPKFPGLEEALELCDRVEGDSYEIDRVSVSNFLGPRAFRHGTGPYDWLTFLHSPWELRPGGYAIRRRGGPGGSYEDVYGAEHPAWKRTGKTHPAARTARRKRASSLPSPAPKEKD